MTILHRLRMGLAEYRAEPFPGDYPDAAVALAITHNELQPRLLLTKRAAHLKLHGGEVAFPGGKRDMTDRDLLHTAMREMHEEVGIAAHWFEVLGSLRQRVTRSGIRVTPYVGLIPEQARIDFNRHEIESVFEVPLSELMRPAHFSVEHVIHEGRERHVAHFEYNGYHVWGMTAMVIADLLVTVLGVDLPVDVGLR